MLMHFNFLNGIWVAISNANDENRELKQCQNDAEIIEASLRYDRPPLAPLHLPFTSYNVEAEA